MKTRRKAAKTLFENPRSKWLYSHGLRCGEDGASHPVEVVHLRLKLGAAMRKGRLGRLRAVEVGGKGVVVGGRDQ